jgi:hypothetical protein
MTQLLESMQQTKSMTDALGNMNYASGGVGGSATSLNLGPLIGANN